MVKKRKVKPMGEKKERKLPEPDPNSEDFIYDEVDKFHRNKDKLMLDPGQQEKEDDFGDEENEEVLGLDLDDSENDEEEVDEEENDDEADDSEDEDDKEEGLPSDQAWGSKKSKFYQTDVDDGDIYASDEEAELAAREEEEEALTLQKRMAERLDEDDFFTVEDDEEADKEEKEETKVVKDLSTMSKGEKLRLLNKQSPELLPLVNEYKESLDELKTYYAPLLKMVQENKIPGISDKCKVLIRTRHQLLMNYLVNISFYLALKAKAEPLKGHPIVDVLYKHKELLSQTKELHDKLVSEFENLLDEQDNENEEEQLESDIGNPEDEESDDEVIISKNIKKKTSTSVKNKTKKAVQKNTSQFEDEAVEDVDDDEEEEEEDETSVDPLEYYNSIKAGLEKRKAVKKLRAEGGDEVLEEVEQFDEDGKRMITYEMSKNKGLTRHRRKDLKNPRVKHKMKFKKAKIKQKSMVREVRTEQTRYGGEATGIKSNLARSVKIK